MNLEQKLIHIFKQNINEDRRDFFPKFYQTFPGGYAEGDIRLGVTVPLVRDTIKDFRHSPLSDIKATLRSKYHEVRLASLLLLVWKYQHSKISEESKQIVDIYLDNFDYINNWDLVDASSYKILGHYYYHNNLNLTKHAKANHFWEKRIGIVANFYFIKNNNLEPIYTSTKYILQDNHRYTKYLIKQNHLTQKQVQPWISLVHKATGWMLREAGKRDKKRLIEFLHKHNKQLPSVLRSYATEKFSKEEKAYVRTGSLQKKESLS